MPRRSGPPYDLFGEIPVSLDELLAWMLSVPRIPPNSPRFGYYVRGYDVIGKIRAAKAAAYGLPPGITWRRVRSGSR